MALIKYDVSDVEAGGGGEEPQPATYPGKVISMVNRKKKANGDVISDLEVVVDIGQEYVRLWTYIKLPDDPAWNKDAHGWKLRELTDALGLPPKGGIDVKKVGGTAVLVKVAADTNQEGGYRGKIKNLFPIGDHAVGEEPVAEQGASDEGPYERSEIEEWPEDDIKSYADEIGADGPQTGRGWKAKLIDSIIAKQDEEVEGEVVADEDGDTATTSNPALEGVDADVLAELNTDPDHYAEWPDEDVKWMVEGLGIDGNVPTSGRGWKAKAIAAIVELAGNEGGEAAAEGEVVDDYDDKNDDGTDTWPLADLKSEIAERNEQGAEIVVPKGRVTREKLIELLREDNKNAEPF